MSQDTENAKGILLRFCSSELTSHASGLIGFSVMLFAYLNVISQFYPDRVPFILSCSLSTSTMRYLVIFGILWAINTFIIYTLGRLAYYGKFAFGLIKYDKPADSSAKLWDSIYTEIGNAKAYKWFSHGISSMKAGFWLSVCVSFAVSFVLIWTFLFY